MLLPLVNALVNSSIGATELFRLVPEIHGEYLSGFCAGADVDDDGIDDIVASRMYPPVLEVYSGRDGHRLQVWSGASEGVGWCLDVGIAGDWNRDGRVDLWTIVQENFDGADQVRVVSGLNGTLLRDFRAPNPRGRFACTLVGDVNRDGSPDLLLGVTTSDAKDTGRARVISGADGSVLREWTGDHPGDRFGESVCIAGDVDGDGVADFAIGAPARGIVRIVSGRDGKTIHTLDDLADSADRQRSEYRDFGRYIAAGADVDGDRVPDVAVAQDVLDGAVLVFSGKTGKQIARIAIGYELLDPKGLHGPYVRMPIALTADIDGDGCAEILVGDSGYFPNDEANGAVVVYSGRTRERLCLVRDAPRSDRQYGDFGMELCVLAHDNSKSSVTFIASCGNGASVVQLTAAAQAPK